MQLRSVLISDAVDQACVEYLKRHDIAVTLRPKMPPQQLLEEIKKHDALIVRSDTKVTAALLEAAPQLKLIGRAGTGVDNIDLEAATKHGVIVINTPGGNSISACELTCTLIASLARHVAPASAALKQGSWERKQYSGTELHGKTLAVLGLGRIGREVAVRMQAFGMKTIGYDPIISAEAAREFHVEKLELEEIWPRADYITVHTPLIPQTRNLINSAVLSGCRHGVRIINVARGGIVDEEALLEAVQSGQCGGAALDVFTEEPPRSPKLLELLKHPRVLATPHLGASTEEAQQRVAVEVAEQFVAISKGEAVSGIVNAPIMASALQACNTPWVSLAQYLGCIASHLSPMGRSGTPAGLAVHVEAFGNELKPGLAGLLGTAALLGQLAGASHNGINLINAPALAREAGIAVTSIHEARLPSRLAELASPAGSALRVRVTQGSGERRTQHTVVGTVRAGTPLLLALEEEAVFGTQGLPLRGHVSFFKADLLNQSLAPLLGSVSSTKTQVLEMCAAVQRGTHQSAGYIALHTALPADVKDAVLPEGVVLLSQHTFN